MILLKRPAFLRDLNRYSAYIAKDDPDAARRLISAAELTCEQIRKHPQIGHQRNFRRHSDIRSWRVEGFDSYLIFYRPGGDSVEILRLLHGAQNLPRFFH